MRYFFGPCSAAMVEDVVLEVKGHIVLADARHLGDDEDMVGLLEDVDHRLDHFVDGRAGPSCSSVRTLPNGSTLTDWPDEPSRSPSPVRMVKP